MEAAKRLKAEAVYDLVRCTPTGEELNQLGKLQGMAMVCDQITSTEIFENLDEEETTKEV